MACSGSSETGSPAVLVLYKENEIPQLLEVVNIPDVSIARENSQRFQIMKQNGESYAFQANSEAECNLWMEWLSVLELYPYSTIPGEPQNISSDKLYQADPRQFRAGKDNKEIVIIHSAFQLWCVQL